MNLETLLYQLHQQREAISEKLDNASRQQLIEYIETSVKTCKVGDDLSRFCGKYLPEFMDLERVFPKEKLSKSDIPIYANKLIKALKEEPLPSQNKDKKEKK